MPYIEAPSVYVGLKAYPGYRLEASGRDRAEDERLELLEQLFDRGSRQRRELVKAGWRYLDVDAGRDTLDAIRDWGLADSALPGSADEEHEALTAACMDPSVWFMTELLHACSGQRPDHQR